MEHRRISCMLLTAGVIALLGGAALFLVYAPVAANECCLAYPDLSFLFWPGLIYLWIIGLLYCMAMFEYFRITLRIRQDRSFCRPNAVGLNHIALFMNTAGLLWALLPFLLALVYGISMGPSALVFLLAAMASFAMGLLAWALGKLLARAVKLKEENDLTV